MDARLAGERAVSEISVTPSASSASVVGELGNLAFDSARRLQGGLEARGKKVSGIHPSAYRHILEMLPRRWCGEGRPSVAMVSAHG